MIFSSFGNTIYSTNEENCKNSNNGKLCFYIDFYTLVKAQKQIIDKYKNNDDIFQFR